MYVCDAVIPGAENSSSWYQWPWQMNYVTLYSSTDRLLANDEFKDQHYDSDDDNPHDRVPVTNQCVYPIFSVRSLMRIMIICTGILVVDMHVYDYCRTSSVGCVRESATCATLSCP